MTQTVIEIVHVITDVDYRNHSTWSTLVRFTLDLYDKITVYDNLEDDVSQQLFGR